VRCSYSFPKTSPLTCFRCLSSETEELSEALHLMFSSSSILTPRPTSPAPPSVSPTPDITPVVHSSTTPNAVASPLTRFEKRRQRIKRKARKEAKCRREGRELAEYAGFDKQDSLA
jgi:hypothetical protein